MPGRRLAHLALAFAAGLGGLAAEACFSSNGGTPADSGAGTDGAGLPDGGPGLDATTGNDAGSQPEAAADTGLHPEAAADAGAGADGGSPNTIVLPGSVNDAVRPGVNRTTGKFYVGWDNSGPPRTHGISVIDARAGSITATINVWAHGGLAVDETNNLIYVPTVEYPDGAASGPPAIYVVDGNTNQVVSASTIYQAQGQTYDAGTSTLQNWGIRFLAIDPAGGKVYAYAGDGFNNGLVLQYDTATRMLTGAISTPGTEPGWGGGLVFDGATHTLWAVAGARPSLTVGATVTTINAQTFTVTNTGPKQAANATDVTLDPTADNAVSFMPVFPYVDGGGSLSAPGTVVASSASGATSSPLPVPAGLAASYGRVLGQRALVYANSAAGAYYLLGFNNPDAGAWAFHGQSAAVTPQPAAPTFDPTAPLDVYGFEAIADATNAYFIALMHYDGRYGAYSDSSIQYWSLPLP
jgi:hypothetical protein